MENPVNPKLMRTTHWLLIVATSLLMLKYFESIFKPLVIAFLFWYLINELNGVLSRIKLFGKQIPFFIRGLMGTGIVVLILLGITEVISVNVSQIIVKSAELENQGDEIVHKLSQKLDNPKLMQDVEKYVRDIDFTNQARTTLNFVSSLFSNFFVVLIYVIFMLLEEGKMKGKLSKLFPNKDHENDGLIDIARKVNESIKTYLVSKTIVSFITGVLGYIVLLLFHVDFPVLWAFLIFLLNYIPYVGSLLATVLPAVYAMFQFGDPMYVIYVLSSIQAVQLLMGSIIEPKLMGKTLNLSPLTVLLSLVIWGYIWGIIGMILSVPITSFLVIIMSHFDSSRPIAIFLSENGEIE